MTDGVELAAPPKQWRFWLDEARSAKLNCDFVLCQFFKQQFVFVNGVSIDWIKNTHPTFFVKTFFSTKWPLLRIYFHAHLKKAMMQLVLYVRNDQWLIILLDKRLLLLHASIAKFSHLWPHFLTNEHFLCQFEILIPLSTLQTWVFQLNLSIFSLTTKTKKQLSWKAPF